MLCIIMRERSQTVTAMELIVSTSSASLHSIFTGPAPSQKANARFLPHPYPQQKHPPAHRNDEVSLDG
jgi:hypothetical protein